MALDNIAPSFVWGANGAKLTPEQIATLQAIEAKRSGGIDVSPVQSWTQGAARVADAIAGAFRRGSIDKAEKENTSYNSSLISDLIGGGSSGASASPSALPMSGAGAEVSASSPSPAAMPVFANDGTELGAYLSDPNRRATLPAGMRNNNPGNIKFVGQKVPGIVGPSVNTDQGDPQAVFDTPESGMRAMYSLLGKKYAGGKLTPNQMIAGNMGWTPGNFEAAKNVARYAGIDPDDDIGFGDPARAAKFMRGLILQEHGNKGALYPDSVISAAVGIPSGAPTQMASAQPQTATDAIAAVSPPSGAIDPNAMAYAPQQAAPALPPATVVPNAPQVAAQPPVPVPPQQQVAQAMTAAPPTANPAMSPAILKVLADPRANSNTKAIAQILIQQQQARQQAIMEQQLKQADPGYQADLALKRAQTDQIVNPRLSPAEKARLELDQNKFTTEQANRNSLTANEQQAATLNRDKFTADTANNALTPDIKEYNFAKQNGYNGSFAQYQIDLKKASAANTTINNGEGNKFYNTLDEANAKIFSGLSDSGIQGRGKLGQIDQLDKLLQSSGTGAMAVLKQKAGDFGIDTAGLSDIQAASAMLSKLIPAQREPGSGPVSDADLAGFRNSLPRLINTPGGNATIINTMRGLTQYQIAQGEIADKVANREITPAEGRSQIANLPNPLANFKAPEAGKEDQGWREISPGVRVRKVQ